MRGSEPERLNPLSLQVFLQVVRELQTLPRGKPRYRHCSLGEIGWHVLSNAKGVASVIPPATPFGVPQGVPPRTGQAFAPGASVPPGPSRRRRDKMKNTECKLQSESPHVNHFAFRIFHSVFCILPRHSLPILDRLPADRTRMPSRMTFAADKKCLPPRITPRAARPIRRRSVPSRGRCSR